MGSDDELIRDLKRLDMGDEHRLRLQHFRKEVEIVRIEEIEDPEWKRREEERRKRYAEMGYEESEASESGHWHLASEDSF